MSRWLQLRKCDGNLAGKNMAQSTVKPYASRIMSLVLHSARDWKRQEKHLMTSCSPMSPAFGWRTSPRLIDRSFRLYLGCGFRPPQSFCGKHDRQRRGITMCKCTNSFKRYCNIQHKVTIQKSTKKFSKIILRGSQSGLVVINHASHFCDSGSILASGHM